MSEEGFNSDTIESLRIQLKNAMRVSEIQREQFIIKKQLAFMEAISLACDISETAPRDSKIYFNIFIDELKKKISALGSQIPSPYKDGEANR